MTVFFTADTHFCHSNIIKYCKRPFADVKEMNHALITNWKAVVRPEDDVYHLGDFCPFQRLESVRQFVGVLPGAIHLILGNHDRSRLYKKILGKLELESVRTAIGPKSFFCDELTGLATVWMKHDPKAFLEVNLTYSKNKLDLFLCGHVHNNWTIRLFHGCPVINVGVDVWGYKPVSLEQIMTLHTAYLKTREGLEDDRQRGIYPYEFHKET